MRLRPTPEETKRAEERCRRGVENAKITWQYNDTRAAREAYYEAIRYRNEQMDWYIDGIEPPARV